MLGLKMHYWFPVHRATPGVTEPPLPGPTDGARGRACDAGSQVWSLKPAQHVLTLVLTPCSSGVVLYESLSGEWATRLPFRLWFQSSCAEEEELGVAMPSLWCGLRSDSLGTFHGGWGWGGVSALHSDA